MPGPIRLSVVVDLELSGEPGFTSAVHAMTEVLLRINANLRGVRALSVAGAQGLEALTTLREERDSWRDAFFKLMRDQASGDGDLADRAERLTAQLEALREAAVDMVASALGWEGSGELSLSCKILHDLLRLGVPHDAIMPGWPTPRAREALSFRAEERRIVPACSVLTPTGDRCAGEPCQQIFEGDRCVGHACHDCAEWLDKQGAKQRPTRKAVPFAPGLVPPTSA